jgi:hypothetical protein
VPRPSNDEVGVRKLALIQTWRTPSGALGDLIVEPRADHVHVWIRWDGDFAVPMEGPDDWRHFLSAVWPVVRDVVDAFRCCLPLDEGFRALLEDVERLG